MLGHRTHLKKFKKIEIISSIFSDHCGMKLEIHCMKKKERHTNLWRLSNMILNNECVKSEIKKEIKNYLDTNENEHETSQNLWEKAKVVLRRKFIVIQA